MSVRTELRTLLEEQVRTAEESFDGALRAYNDARDALYTSYTDLNSYRRALEAATRGTNSPYHPPPLINPLDGPPPRAEDVEKPEPPTPAKKGRVEVPTKKGIILAALTTANGRGMKPKDVLKAIPPDAPIKITKADIDRALPRLADEEKAWRDTDSFYHAGQRPADALAGELLQGFKELE